MVGNHLIPSTEVNGEPVMQIKSESPCTGKHAKKRIEDYRKACVEAESKGYPKPTKG